jgi:pimeloyl-ACP methyl ester carboxylesterase
MAISRTPYLVIHRETSAFKDVYGGAGEMVVVECMRIADPATPAKRAIIFSHPIGGGAFLPLVSALAHAGHHVLYVNPRYRGNDSALIMEKCVADLGAAIKDAEARWGYDEIILGGWSGGGSLSLFYQDQAETPTITHTPAGDPLDLTALGLPPVQGIMLLAAHISRAVTLTEWMDPSIRDEAKPFDRDPDLNIYDPTNPHHPPMTQPLWIDSGRLSWRATGESRPGSRFSCQPLARGKSAASPCTGRWPMSAGRIRTRTRLIVARSNAIWECRASPMTVRLAWRALRLSGPGCRSGVMKRPTRTGLATPHEFHARCWSSTTALILPAHQATRNGCLTLSVMTIKRCSTLSARIITISNGQTCSAQR